VAAPSILLAIKLLCTSFDAAKYVAARAERCLPLFVSKKSLFGIASASPCQPVVVIFIVPVFVVVRMWQQHLLLLNRRDAVLVVALLLVDAVAVAVDPQ
jgi:hypothetical protein